MSAKTIDLNCDLGEWRQSDGPEKDTRIMPFISSCNVACGGHIGDETSMRATIKLAKKHGVRIGAHPSYPDPENFGRIVPEISGERLLTSIKTQINTLFELLKEADEPLHHIKPHGALYNFAAKDEPTARIIVEAVKSISSEIPIYAQHGSVLAEVAGALGIPVVYEVFADRAYEQDLSLRSRALEGAVLHDTDEVLKHIERMVLQSEVVTFEGNRRPILAQTVCLHSDTEGSIRLAEAIHYFLSQKDVTITAP